MKEGGPHANADRLENRIMKTLNTHAQESLNSSGRSRKNIKKPKNTMLRCENHTSAYNKNQHFGDQKC